MSDVSLNHLIGGSQQCLWDSEAEGFGGLEVDNEFELGRLRWRSAKKRSGRISAVANTLSNLGALYDWMYPSGFVLKRRGNKIVSKIARRRLRQR
jgi:hypothetical protein